MHSWKLLWSQRNHSACILLIEFGKHSPICADCCTKLCLSQKSCGTTLLPKLCTRDKFLEMNTSIFDQAYLKIRKNHYRTRKNRNPAILFWTLEPQFRARLMYNVWYIILSEISYSTTFVWRFLHENAQLGLRIVATTGKHERNRRKLRFHHLVLDAVVPILELG